MIDRAGGGDRKDATGGRDSGSALSIVLGTALDGIRESVVIELNDLPGRGGGRRVPDSGVHLADTMMPEAFEHGGKLVGVVTKLGFAVAFTIHVLDRATARPWRE